MPAPIPEPVLQLKFGEVPITLFRGRFGVDIAIPCEGTGA